MAWCGGRAIAAPPLRSTPCTAPRTEKPWRWARGGLVLHNSGLLGEDTPWLPQDSGTSFSLYDVTSAGGNRAYASGFNGLVLEYDDGEWTILTTGFHDRLNSVHMNPCGDILAGGLWGLIIRYGH